MIDYVTAEQILEAAAHRREERRRFLKFAGSTSVAAGGLALLSACGGGDSSSSPTPTPTPSSTASPTPTPTATNFDPDILNFALNLEYLEAQFYTYAVTGAGLPAAQTASGSGAAGGTVTGGAQVDFTGEPLIAAYAREIAADEAAHVAFLRAALGGAAVAMPNLNISGDANGAFTAAARASGVITASQTFDPYASPNNFLLGAYIFEDVGVSAYKGAAPLITNATYLEAAAGILAAEAYHAGLVRTVLYARGMDATLVTNNGGVPRASLIGAANAISDGRDSLDGTVASSTVAAADDDQGITVSGVANLVPADGNGLAYSRSVSQVLNIVYLNTLAATAGASMGGFFPNGVNANLAAFKTSAANP